jgi:hypothetical protein
MPDHSPRRYLALYDDGRHHELEAMSKAAAITTAIELFGAGLVRVTEEGEW